MGTSLYRIFFIAQPKTQPSPGQRRLHLPQPSQPGLPVSRSTRGSLCPVAPVCVSPAVSPIPLWSPSLFSPASGFGSSCRHVPRPLHSLKEPPGKAKSALPLPRMGPPACPGTACSGDLLTLTLRLLQALCHSQEKSRKGPKQPPLPLGNSPVELPTGGSAHAGPGSTAWEGGPASPARPCQPCLALPVNHPAAAGHTRVQAPAPGEPLSAGRAR